MYAAFFVQIWNLVIQFAVLHSFFSGQSAELPSALSCALKVEKLVPTVMFNPRQHNFSDLYFVFSSHLYFVLSSDLHLYFAFVAAGSTHSRCNIFVFQMDCKGCSSLHFIDCNAKDALLYGSSCRWSKDESNCIIDQSSSLMFCI